MYVIIDNYDSFTYNLFQYLAELTSESIKVFRNDRISLAQIEALEPEGIVISPGPGRPEDAGISTAVIRRFVGKIPILGVCLGHQAVAYAFGARIVGARSIVHGKVEPVTLDGRGLFRNIPSPVKVTRYHSLAVDPSSIPEELEVTATASDGTVMGLRHTMHTVEGVQFHPESIGSEYGREVLKNFLRYRREPFPYRALLTKVMAGEDLTFEEMDGFMDELTNGDLSSSRVAGFLVGLNAKGISSEEIAGAAAVLRRKGNPVSCEGPALDTCGTGGDGLGTFNISSITALLASACGATVAKHGNRAVSSRFGSADFYGVLGIATDLLPVQAEELMRDTGFAFLFAPLYHPAMRHAAQPRRELGVKTIMNMIGPLSNPAGANYQLIGVFDRSLGPLMAKAALRLGVERVMVVHGQDGQDEMSVTAPTDVVEADSSGGYREYVFEPSQIGVKSYPLEQLIPEDQEENLRETRALLDGSGREALREAVCLNTGAALYVCGLADTVASGYALAREALQAGRAKEKVQQIVEAGRAIKGRTGEDASAGASG
jgi:anthranilate synthase/phosphoribosyltransferase